LSGFKSTFSVFLILGVLLYAGSALSQDNKIDLIDFARLQGAYLGQQPPGLAPEIFAEGIISKTGFRLHGFPTFSPDGREIFWSVIPPQIMFTREISGNWTPPKPAPFLKGNLMAPFMSPNGDRIYFQAKLPEGCGSLDIWYIEREADGWSDFKNLDKPPNSERMESQPTLARNGNLYFIGPLEGVAFNRGIYVAEFIDGRYAEPALLPEVINTESIDYTPFIAPDESYLLFASSRPGAEETDIKLYVSFHNDDNGWDTPVNLSEKLKLEHSARFPSVTPDGKCLFYLSGDGNLYWVSSEIIDQIKTTAKTTGGKCELNKKNRGCIQ